VPMRSKHPTLIGHTNREPLSFPDQVNGANRSQDQCVKNGSAAGMKHIRQLKGRLYWKTSSLNDRKICEKLSVNEIIEWALPYSTETLSTLIYTDLTIS
jgi:hypothetical protein